MRGNERHQQGDHPIRRQAREFTIPMRGNEMRGALVHDGFYQLFTIPMRGNDPAGEICTK